MFLYYNTKTHLLKFLNFPNMYKFCHKVHYENQFLNVPVLSAANMEL
jgi:hypothetical protein